MQSKNLSCSLECSSRDKGSGNCAILGEDNLPVQCVGDWAEEKYWFLERYVDATKQARKKFEKFGNAVFIDLFSGPGRCRIRYSGKEIDNGAVKVMKYREVPFNEYHLVDFSKDSVDALQKRTSKIAAASYYSANVNSIAANLVSNLLKSKYARYHLVYADPFGPEALSFETIRALSTLERLDILIHFPVGPLKRNVARWVDTDSCALDTFIGTREWRDRVKKVSTSHYISEILDIYKKKLIEVGFPADGLEVIDKENIRENMPSASVFNSKEVELYKLILASKHKLGQIIWKNVIKKTPNGQLSIFP